MNRRDFFRSSLAAALATSLANGRALAALAPISADIEAVEAYDAATDGNRLWYEPLPAPVTFVAGDIPQFDAGELTFNVV